MSTHALEHAPAATEPDDRPGDGGVRPDGGRAGATGSREAALRPGSGGTRRGLLGLAALGVALVAAAVLLGARTWQVGSGLGAAFFPVEDIVELAAVAVGTVAAGWTGGHALLALACVLAGRRGRRWAAGERTVARNAPSIVLRLARVAAGAGVGLALAAPTAMALPHDPAIPAADAGPAVVLDLGWRPTSGSSGESGSSGKEAATGSSRAGSSGEGAASAQPRERDERETANRPGSSASSGAGPGAERSSLVARSRHTDERTVVVEAGDTLWSIAADGIAREADTRAGAGARAGTPAAAEIVDAVGRWHEVNRAVLGADPDLVRPGMVLREP
ncbi:hypothetical protein GCM10010413_05630 [Promicromonospora sukumoe]|uniref:LysM domain-containing protein n=1 Tax=Promicromonospora sukumoe TaxID=88382 RepID=A0A7W3PC17_9MICO|nr:LysM domain-containing protein [Promicromonospora sukumoe]MBA8806156.1 hypothetical protein [Promicromonospora sukumoe]